MEGHVTGRNPLEVPKFREHWDMLAQRFYASLLCCNLVWWSIVFLSTRRCSKLNGKTRALDRHGLACRPLYAICPMPTVLTRPSWVPTSFVVSLHRFRALLFLAVPLSLYYAAVDELCNTWVRLTTACIFTLYHLCESSATNRYLIASPHLNHSPHAHLCDVGRLGAQHLSVRSHGEYPILYDVWALCLPDDLAHAACFGIAVHFVFAAGIAKLSVGGLSWMRPETMITYLDCYRRARAHRRARTRAIPPQVRWYGTCCMQGLEVKPAIQQACQLLAGA